MPLIVYDGEGNLRDSLGVWRGLERARVSISGQESRLPVPFARSAVYDGRGNATVIGVSDSLDLWLFDGTTRQLHLVGAGAGAPPLSTDLEAWSRNLRAKRPDVATLLLDAEHDVAAVKSMPAIGGVVLDDKHNIWVGSYAAPGATSRHWRVFSARGELIGSTDLPAFTDPLMPSRTELMDVFGERLALLRESDDGAQYVEVRAIAHP